MIEIKTTTSYPPLLKEIYDLPEKLYYSGNLAILENPCIAFVGTRKATPYGLAITDQLIQQLSIYKVTIVSGLALGIDTQAHKSALEYKLPTVAILGSGLNNIYPTQNQKLAEQITQNGLLLSEYKPDQSPRKHHFPMRNRLISGISLATVVIEAPIKSGSLITAKSALEQNREVFTIPGDIDKPNSLGPLHLLQQGAAYPISSAKDIIDNLQETISQTKRTQLQQLQLNLDPEKQKIINNLSKLRLRPLAKIHSKTNYPLPKLLALLGELEIEGIITTKNNQYKLN